MAEAMEKENLPESEGTVDVFENMNCALSLRFYKEELVVGPGIARLMELVDRTGSISESCRVMNMAYSKAWKLIKRSEAAAGCELFSGSRGGRNGGRTRLTAEGERLLLKYRDMENKLKELMLSEFER